MKHTTHITVVTSDMSEQHAIFGSGAYRVSSREMWRDLRENQITVSKSLEDIQKLNQELEFLSEDILAEFEKIRRGNHKKTDLAILLFR